jgi:peptidyl-prolyl cis-trans isomerase SurA
MKYMSLSICKAAIFALWMVCEIPSAYANKNKVIERIVAVVNNEIILWSEWKRQYEGMREKLKDTVEPEEAKKQLSNLKLDILNKMIDDLLLEQVAREMQMAISSEEVDAAVEDTRKRYNLTPEQFREAQFQQGFTPDTYRAMVQRELRKLRLLRTVLQEKVQISPEDERAFYNKLINTVTPGPLEYYLRHILIAVTKDAKPEELEKAKVQATKLLEQAIKQPDQFEPLAKKYSQDVSKEEGGSLGWLKRGDVHPVLEAAMISLKKGQVHNNLLRTEIGFHILYLADKRQSGVLSFEEARANIHQELQKKAFTRAYDQYIAELRKKAVIELRFE